MEKSLKIGSRVKTYAGIGTIVNIYKGKNRQKKTVNVAKVKYLNGFMLEYNLFALPKATFKDLLTHFGLLVLRFPLELLVSLYWLIVHLFKRK